MTGLYDIEIYNNRVHYFLTVKRNITVLQGNSATGKTELIRLLQDYEANGASSGITVLCNIRCTVLTPVDWEVRLDSMKQSIVFIDETASFVRSKDFAEKVRGSDNYFVIISRDPLHQLPYSVDEIYGLHSEAESQKYKTYHRIYTEMYRLYNFDINRELKPDIVITEDSNSGYEFFKEIYPVECLSAKGKSKVYSMIRNNDPDKSLLVIVDGAAFGSEIGKITGYLNPSGYSCVIYAPESFEYLLLKADIVDVPSDVLDKTYDYADSIRYMSWEEFYSAYLIDICKDSIYQYRKQKLSKVYKSPAILQKIVTQLPEQIKPDRFLEGL